VKCWAEFAPGSAEYNANYVSQLEVSQLGPEPAWVDNQMEVGLLTIERCPPAPFPRHFSVDGDSVKNRPICNGSVKYGNCRSSKHKTLHHLLNQKRPFPAGNKRSTDKHQ
jgi:hypothetical protein